MDKSQNLRYQIPLEEVQELISCWLEVSLWLTSVLDGVIPENIELSLLELWSGFFVVNVERV